MIKPTIVILTVLTLVFSASLAIGQDGKVRIFILESRSWEMSGGVAASPDGAGGGVSGGARPQTAEIMKTFADRCPSCTVTIDKTKADYSVRLDHEGGKMTLLRDNKVAVFNRDGDMIYSSSTRSLGNAVKDACAAIEKDRLTKPPSTGTVTMPK